ncbi:hypothetical protein LWI29_018558 [Acer saccharum]|uniref:Uncharacterized protein n=1 Tax=Acer saccharum TaxID=4024 RepID=A0AA39TTX4_ACESA|nr:hypothetical protein LWI29_018558 [Acer saccharum]
MELLSVGKHLEEPVMSTLSDPKEPVMSPLPELQPPTHYKPLTKDKKKKQNPKVKNVDGAVRAELAALEALIAASTPSTFTPPAFQPYVPAVQATAPLSTQSGPFTFA